MGIYIFKREALAEWLTGGPGEAAHDLGRDVIPRAGPLGRSLCLPFHGYWADVGTVQAYYEANMALLAETPALDLYDPDWVDPHAQRGTAGCRSLGADARAQGNLLCDGCRIEGTVIRSIISPGVYVAPGATVRDSIVMTDAVDRGRAPRWIGPSWTSVCWWQQGPRWAGATTTRPTASGPNGSTPASRWSAKARPSAGRTLGRNVVVFPKVVAQTSDGEGIASGTTLRS